MTALSVEEVNCLALMAAAGIEDERAAEKLGTRVAITVGAGSACEAIAAYTRQLLERTLQVVDDSPVDVEVVIGNRTPVHTGLVIGVVIKHDSVTFASTHAASTESGAEVEPPKLLLKIAACYLAGHVIAKSTASDAFEGIPSPFVVSAQNLGFDRADFSRKFVFDGTSVLVGAGGVANGFLWALEDLDVSGRLYVCDPKSVSRSNLNRCLYFAQEDLHASKVEVLAKKALQGKVELIPYHGEFKTLVTQLGRVRRAYTTVDSRRIRRNVRGELPLEILDASTTDISEVIVFSERQPTSMACLSCIYAHIPEETQREQHIADALGVNLGEVQQSLISDGVADKLARKHPTLVASQIRGTAFDSLFRQMCGAGTLLTSPAKQVLAPLGFISNLAGCLLALELFRFEGAGTRTDMPNYMALDPWRPPHRRARLSKAAKDDCEFCSRPESHDVLKTVWKDILA